MTFELPITGGCSCGDVRYVIAAQPSMSFVCFCRECQMSGGTEGAPVVVVDRNAASISGSARKRTYRADNGSDMEAYFCGGCGSRLYGLSSHRPDHIMFRVGCFDDPQPFNPQAYLYVSRMPPWVSLQPDVARFDALPTDD